MWATGAVISLLFFVTVSIGRMPGEGERGLFYIFVIDCMSIDFLNMGAPCAPTRTKFVDIASNSQAIILFFTWYFVLDYVSLTYS